MDNKDKKVRGHRRKHVPPLKKRLVNLTEDQAKLLRKWGRGDISAGLRWLIDSAASLVLKRDDLEQVLNTHVQDEQKRE